MVSGTKYAVQARRQEAGRYRSSVVLMEHRKSQIAIGRPGEIHLLTNNRWPLLERILNREFKPENQNKRWSGLKRLGYQSTCERQTHVKKFPIPRKPENADVQHYPRCVRRLPFTALVIQKSVDLVGDFPSTLYVSFLVGVVSLTWLALWTFGAAGTVALSSEKHRVRVLSGQKIDPLKR